MNIIGAGLTGCLAAYAFKQSTIHEFLPQPKIHSAVLRFRSEAVSQLTGIPFRKVTVHKGVYVNGLFLSPDIRLLNQYSKKVTGGYYDRSIADLSPSIRYIAPKDFHALMLDNLADNIVCNSSVDFNSLSRPVISTLPLPILMDKLGMPSDWLKQEKLVAKPIWVTTIRIPKADAYQTVYFPDPHKPYYRASLTGDMLIIEAVEPIQWFGVLDVLRAFGLGKHEIESLEECMNVKQEHGKFVPLDDELRKQLMYRITNEHNIYSLGRHATWRKVLLDDIVKDLDRIDAMLHTSAYDRMLGKTK